MAELLTCFSFKVLPIPVKPTDRGIVGRGHHPTVLRGRVTQRVPCDVRMSGDRLMAQRGELGRPLVRNAYLSIFGVASKGKVIEILEKIGNPEIIGVETARRRRTQPLPL